MGGDRCCSLLPAPRVQRPLLDTQKLVITHERAQKLQTVLENLVHERFLLKRNHVMYEVEKVDEASRG